MIDSAAFIIRIRLSVVGNAFVLIRKVIIHALIYVKSVFFDGETKEKIKGCVLVATCPANK